MNRRILLTALAAAASVSRVQAQPQSAEWSPDRPIRLIVGFAPGGSTDITGRLIAQTLANIGQPALVENRVGAAGNIATEHVARSAPDGHTLVVASMGSQAVNAALYRSLPFDPVRDFVAVTLFVRSSNLLVVHPSVQARSVADLVAFARANPGRLNVGIAGAGSSQHFAAALFEHRADVRFTHIVYRGGAPAMTDLVAGRVDLVFSPVVETLQQFRAGQVRALGISREQRSPDFPDIPAIAETVPGYSFASWLGLFAPAGTPPAAVQRIAREVAAGLRDPQIRERVQALGYEPVGSTPEEFAAFFAAEMPRVAELVRLSGARVE
ncbi:MAG TPA: tripartite tricarboxylate transporter substrate binding protein [Acetobacteraceae bacterium]|nr:tripartite tricarboxylate transporter substrate binding protein [Acetobacteraceae bacterium]